MGPVLVVRLHAARTSSVEIKQLFLRRYSSDQILSKIDSERIIQLIIKGKLP